MRPDALCLLVFTLGAATTVRTAYQSRKENVVSDPFVDATNMFSVALMKEVFKRPGNAIISPLSVSTLLAMLQQGARESSSVQLENILHMNSAAALSGFHGLITSLKTRQSRSRFNFGNSMFVNQDFDLLYEYRDAMAQNFHATVEPVDFKYPSKAAKKINEWVANTTQGKIAEIVRPEAISGRTEMVLANAMYFKGAWFYPFVPTFTKKLPFYARENPNAVNVDMMAMGSTLRAGEDTDSLNAKWIELPYEGYGQEYAMIVVLPNDNLEAMMSRLTASHLSSMAKSTSIRDVTLKMPRFKMETDLSLVPTLQALGLLAVFNQESNLEGISTTKHPLIVSDVLHKAQIEVNEHGSEAAAASSILVNTLSLTPEYEKMGFIANKPFLAMIVDKVSSVPLFVAKIANPSRK